MLSEFQIIAETFKNVARSVGFLTELAQKIDLAAGAVDSGREILEEVGEVFVVSWFLFLFFF